MLQTVESLAQENEYLRNIWRSKFHSLKFFPECWRHNTFPTQAGYHFCYCCCCYFCCCFDFCLAFSIQTQGFLCSPSITGLQFVQLDFQIPLPERSRFNVLPMRGICVRLGRQKWDKLFSLQRHLACGRFVAISWKLLKTHHLQTQVDVITLRVAVISYNFPIFWRTAINLRQCFLLPYFLMGLRAPIFWTYLLLFNGSVMSNSLQPHGCIMVAPLQHTRLPCPSLSPRVCSNSCPVSWWGHPTMPSSVTPFSSCPQFSPNISIFSNELALCSLDL